MGSQSLKMKAEIDLELDGEFEDLIKKVETKLYKEVLGGKVTLFLESNMDLDDLKEDTIKLKTEASYINTVHEIFGYPWIVIEFVRNIEEAEKYARRKRDFQEKAFGVKYTEEQFMQLIVDAFHQLNFSKYTMDSAVGKINRRWFY